MLLDKIFKVNEKERITIDGIREDPWYQGPLQKKFSEAEERICKQQREVEERCRQRALNPVSASHGQLSRYRCLLRGPSGFSGMLETGSCISSLECCSRVTPLAQLQQQRL